MTIAEQLRAEGRTEGRAEGRASTLVELLALKFGEPSDEHLARIRTASEAQLRRWLERVLSASSIEAVFADS